MYSNSKDDPLYFLCTGVEPPVWKPVHRMECQSNCDCKEEYLEFKSKLPSNAVLVTDLTHREIYG